jgi:hypothetical protein
MGPKPESEAKKPVRFFDSHGGLWETCSANDPEAQAFGPQGAAKEISAEKAGLELNQVETIYSAAKRAGRVIKKEENTDWELLSE